MAATGAAMTTLRGRADPRIKSGAGHDVATGQYHWDAL
jgi:hypothetical protein